MWTRWRIRTARAVSSHNHESLENPVLLLLLLLVPVLMLGVLTYATKRPFLSPMYTIYTTVAIYIALGDIISSVPHVGARTLAVLSLSALYGYQLLIFLPDVTRVDWRSGAEYVQESASPNDLVLELQYLYPVNYIDYYLSGQKIPVQRVTTFQAACEEAVSYLAEAPSGDGSRSVSVWLVTEKAFISWLFPSFNTIAALDAGLSARGLKYGYREFPGHYNLLVVRIGRDPARTPLITEEPVASLMPLDYANILQELDVSFSDEASRSQAIAALRKEITIWPPLCKFFLVVHSVDLLQARHAGLAEAVARMAVKRHPTYGLGHFALGLALASQRDPDGASIEFDAAFTCHKGLGKLLRPFVSALCHHQEPAALRAEIKKLETMNFVFDPALRDLFLGGWRSPSDRLPVQAAQAAEEAFPLDLHVASASAWVRDM